MNGGYEPLTNWDDPPSTDPRQRQDALEVQFGEFGRTLLGLLSDVQADHIPRVTDEETWVEIQKNGKHPKMDGENNGNPY